MKTAVEWLYDQIENEGKCIYEVMEQAKEMEEQEKVEFAFRAYSEMLTLGKSFVDIVDNMRTFK
jgi:hypothetical protein